MGILLITDILYSFFATMFLLSDIRGRFRWLIYATADTIAIAHASTENAWRIIDTLT